MRPKTHFFYLTFILALSADQITKYFFGPFGQSLFFFPFLKFVFHANYGIALGFTLPFYLLWPLLIGLLCLLAYLLINHLNYRYRLNLILAAFLSAGALGNVLDRLFYGYVIDFISVFSFPIFNLADAYITVSVCALILYNHLLSRNSDLK